MTIDLSSRATRRLLSMGAVLLALFVAGLSLTLHAQRADPGNVSAETPTPCVSSGIGQSCAPVDLAAAAQSTSTGSTGVGIRVVVRPAATAKPARPVMPSAKPTQVIAPGGVHLTPVNPPQPAATAKPAQPVAPAARPTQGVAPTARPVKPTRPGAPLPPARSRLVPVRPGAARPPVATPERPPNSCAPGPGRNCPDPAPAAPIR